MRIFITVKELMDRNLWTDYCSITGTNEWAVKEGLLSENDEVELTEEQAKEMGVIK